VLLKKMNNFQANFSQLIRSSTGEKISDTKGEMKIRRPNQFYWKSSHPDPVIVIADGQYLWTYDVDLAQATKQSLDKALKESPASLLAGSLDNFEKNFVVNYAKPGKCKKSGGQCFLLKSKQKDSTFRNIYIGFEESKLVEVRMSDPLEQDIYTTFSNVEINQNNINSALFKFVPPKNVDVINYD
jgi:outer membrane lipoprotein carrier protein